LADFLGLTPQWGSTTLSPSFRVVMVRWGATRARAAYPLPYSGSSDLLMEARRGVSFRFRKRAPANP
jgi:hypothetical protein